MPKQLKVSLDFTANTDQAKRQIQDLSKALQQITLKTPSVIDDQQLKRAASAANELQRYLAAAVNVDTGKINLSEFSRQLDKSGRSLAQLHDDLIAIGPDGVSAFNKLSQGLIQAETHSNKLTKKMKEFGTTLANTARWQISSSILHGLQGAVQSAFYYAKDLDESLNNIRIVTGQNADQMARFAKEANAAAQSLSTTTTAYTNASLIYYQQGLNDEEVKKRTDVTVKMANVTGESAQTISEQMTAVWNNFYDGSQSLESFSDKMVALGAATASSSSEISAGLNQFAATANTVGLSFDYAAAALATVTATTRQSANVVGNSFKTLFARLEGLSLGETLEDGTNLNKYSAALEKVGISIKDQNGELKAMDAILDELGSRWQTLAKDQQVALAQTVGGVRQYTQLIALMDNWDFMQENLQTVRGSEGALQEQQKIYEEGWRAAADRVKAALEGIYDTLIDDSKIKKLYDFGADALNFINGIIKGFGGVKGILTQVASIILQIQAKNLSAMVANLRDSIASNFGNNLDQSISKIQELQNFYASMPRKVNESDDAEAAIETEKTFQLLQLKEKILVNSKEMSAAETAIAEKQMQQIENEFQILELAGKILNKTNERLKKNKESIIQTAKLKEGGKAINLSEGLENLDTYARQLKDVEKAISDAKTATERWASGSKGSIEEVVDAMESYLNEQKDAFNLDRFNTAGRGLTSLAQMEDMIKKAKEGSISVEQLIQTWEKFQSNAKVQNQMSISLQDARLEVEKFKHQILDNYDVKESFLDDIIKDAKDAREAYRRLYEAQQQLAEKAKKTGDGFKHFSSSLEGLANMASGFTAVFGGIQSVLSTYDTLTDKSANGTQKFGAILSSFSAVSMGAVRGVGMMRKALESFGVAATASLGPAIAIVAVFAAIAGAIAIYNKVKEEQAERIHQNAVESQEELKALKEESKALEENKNKYSELLKTYRETGQGKEELDKVGQELVEQYGDEEDKLLLLQKRYDDLAQSIENTTRKKEEAIRVSARRAAADARADFEEGASDTWADSFWDQYKNTTSAGSTNEFLQQAFLEGNYSTLTASEHLQAVQVGMPGSPFLGTLPLISGMEYNINKGSDLLTVYEESEDWLNSAMALAKTEAEQKALEEDIAYQQVKEWLRDNKEKYEIAKELIDEDSYNSLVEDYGVQQVNSLEEYQQVAATIKQASDTNAETISKFLSDNFSNYAQIDKNLDAAVKQSNNQFSKTTLQKIYESLSPEDQEIFFQINFDKMSSAQAILDEISHLQSIADRQSIQVEVNTYTSAKDQLKEDMSKEDYLSFQTNSGIDWGNEEKNIIKFADFLRMTYEEQIAYIEGLENAAREKSDKLTQDIIADLGGSQQKVKALEAQLSEAQTNYDQASTLGNYEVAERYAKDIQNISIDLAKAKDDSIELQNELDQIEIEGILDAGAAESIEELITLFERGKISAEDLAKNANKLKDKLDDEIETEDWERLADYLKQNQKELKGFTKELNVADRVFKRISQSILRWDNAVKEITDSYDDWMDALESGNAKEAAEAAEQMRDTYADLLDLPFDTLSAQFLQNTENLKLMQQAATGDEEAYRSLQAAVREDILAHISVDKADWDAQYQNVLAEYDRLNGLEDLEVGASINDEGFLNACNEMIAAAGMTYEQATNFLSSMGVDAELEPHETTVSRTSLEFHPAPMTTDEVSVGYSDMPTKYRFPQKAGRGHWEPVTDTETITAWTIKTSTAKKSSGGNFKANNSSAGGGGGKSGGGGGGGSKKTGSAEHAKKASPQKSEDRYHVINNQIEDLAKQYDRLSEAEERAFGKAKLDLMEQQRKKLDEQYKAQRKLREEAEKYWKEDLDNLKNASIDSDGDGNPDTFGFERFNQDNWYANTHKDDQGNSLGPLDLLLDENGTILNYDQLTAAAYDFYNAKVAEYNQWLDDNYIGKEVDEAIEEEKKQREEGVKQEEGYLNNFLGLVKQYEDTQDKVQEEFNKEIEAYHAELDKMFENTEYAIQIKLDVDEDKLKVLEFLMATLEDNAYRAGEAVANLQNQFAITGDKYENNKSAIEGLFDTHFAADHEFDNDNLDVGNNTFAAKMRDLGLNSGADIVASLISGNTSLETILGSMGQEFSEQDIKAFREYTEAMMNDAESLLKIHQDMFKQLDDYISQTNDDLDRTRCKIENLSKVTEHWKNLIDLVGRDTAGLDTQEMIDNEAESLKVLQAKVAADKDLMDEAEAVLSGLKAEEGKYKEGTNEWNEWKKRVEEAEDRFNEMTENFYSSWEEALQAVKEKFEKTMQWLGEDYSKALGGKAGNLEGLQNLMDQYQKTHDTYVPEFERVYQLNKLNAAAVKAIDETNNIKAKKQLQEYQQQILEAQESGREMSEYELQNLEKELALRQAALALEESRNVKSQVRMQRDNEGNYSYVYTADEDAVADAENNYRDKLYEMQKANYEYINELQNNIVSLQQDYQQAIANAAEVYGYGTEAYYDAVDKINSYYDEALKAQYDELNLAMKNNQDLQEFDKNFHAQMTHDKSVSDEGYITNFDQTLYSQLTGYETLEGATQAWSEASANYISGATTAVNDYKSALEATCIYAGTTLKEQVTEPGGVYYQFGEKAKEAFAKAGKEAYGDGKLDDKNTLMGKVHLMAEQARKDLLGDGGENKGLIGTVGSFVEKTSEYINSLITDTTNLSTAIGNVIEQLSELGKAKIPEPKTPSGDDNSPSGDDNSPSGEDNGSSSTNDSSSNGNSGGSESGTGNNNLTKTLGTKSINPTGDALHGHSKGEADHSTSQTVQNGAKEEQERQAKNVSDIVHGVNTVASILEKNNQKSIGGNKEGSTLSDLLNTPKSVAKFIPSKAAGGYTGQWGPNGKLAILHEKELVLNEKDTSNMLAAVGMIRQISDVIDLNAKSSGGAFSSLFAANVRTGAQELQQDVHITAEFPNATDHNEILEAFDNVINLASQYANRKVQPAYTSF